MFNKSSFRSRAQLRRDACSKDLSARADEEYFGPADRLNALRDKLKYPSDRLAVVEEFYQTKLTEIPAPERELAEAVAHAPDDKRSLAYFAEARIGAAIERLPSAPLLLEFNQAFLAELEAERSRVADYLRPAFVAYCCESELEATETARFGHIVKAPCGPLRQIDDMIDRARQAIAQGGDSNAMHSTFAGLTKLRP